MYFQDVKPMFKSQHTYAFIWIRLIMTMLWNVHVLRSYRDTYKPLEQIHNALNKQGSFSSAIYRCPLKYKLQIPSPKPVKVNYNPADNELSRLKDTN